MQRRSLNVWGLGIFFSLLVGIACPAPAVLCLGDLIDQSFVLGVRQLNSPPASISISPDGTKVAIGRWGAGPVVLLTNPESAALPKELDSPARGAFSLAEFGRDGQIVVASGKKLRVDIEACAEAKAPGKILRLQRSDYGDHIAAVIQGGSVVIYRYPELTKEYRLRIPRPFPFNWALGWNDSVGGVAFSPDDSTVAISFDDGSTAGVYAFDLATGKPKRGWQFPYRMAGPELAPARRAPYIQNLHFTPDGQEIVTTCTTYSGANREWVDMVFVTPVDGATSRAFGRTYAQAHTPRPHQAVSSAVATGAPVIAVGLSGTYGFGAPSWIRQRRVEDGTLPKVRVFDRDSGKLLAVLYGHASAVDHVAFTPDGRSLLTLERNGILAFWDLARLRTERPQRAGFSGTPGFLQVSPFA